MFDKKERQGKHTFPHRDIWKSEKKNKGPLNQEKYCPNLVQLSKLKSFEVHKKDPDVRGFRVFDIKEKSLGIIEDLIVDTVEMKVRYLFVNFTNLSGHEGQSIQLLLPVGVASIDGGEKKVYLKGIKEKNLSTCPPYNGDPITREFECILRESLNNNFDYEERPVSEFYESSDYDENLFFGKTRSYHSISVNFNLKK